MLSYKNELAYINLTAIYVNVMTILNSRKHVAINSFLCGDDFLLSVRPQTRLLNCSMFDKFYCEVACSCPIVSS